MADDEYSRKMQVLQQYIPFLENMITQLKDPNKKNREQQLSKMESLYAMITDRKKKLKLDTLNKCEEVISKLYEKVNHKIPLQQPRKESPSCSFTPASPSSTPTSPTWERSQRKPKIIPTERIDIPKVDIYSSAAESLRRNKACDSRFVPKTLPDTSKPPISLEDLKTLEEDVQDRLNESANLNELASKRDKIAAELILEEFRSMAEKQAEEDINTTIRNNLNLSKKSIDVPKKYGGNSSKHSAEPKASQVEAKKNTVTSKIVKVEGSTFGSILSNIDDQILGGRKKTDERRSSITEKDEKVLRTEETSEKKDHKKREGSPGKRDRGKKRDESEREKHRKRIDKGKNEDRNKRASPDKSDISRDKRKDDFEKDRSTRKDERDKHKSDYPHKKDSELTERREHVQKDQQKDLFHKDGEKNDRLQEHSEKETMEEEHLKKEDTNKECARKEDTKSEHSIKIDCCQKDEKVSHVSIHLSTTDNHKTNGDEVTSSKQDQAGDNQNIRSDDSAIPVEELSKIIVKKIEDLKESITVPKVEPTTSYFKRLADKYNPKPKKPILEIDVDKSVENSIEESMKTVTPPKMSMPMMAAPVPPPAKLIAYSQMEPELPDTRPTPSLIHLNIGNSPNPIGHFKGAPEIEHERPVPFRPNDNFVSDYARDDFDFNRQLHSFDTPREQFPHNQGRHFEQPPQQLQRNQVLSFESPQQVNSFDAPQQVRSFDPPQQVHPFDLPQRTALQMPVRLPSQSPNQFMIGPQQNRFSNPGIVADPRIARQSLNQNFNMEKMDFYPNGPPDANHFVSGQPLRHEIHQFQNEQKHFVNPAHHADMRWERNNFDPAYRGPMTYREYREMKEQNMRDPRENRDQRDNWNNRDNWHRDPRMNREVRDPRCRGPSLEMDPRDPRDRREGRDPRDLRDARDPRLRDREIRDPRLKREQSIPSDYRHSRYDSKFDRVYSDFRGERSRSRSRSRNRFDRKDTFLSPLDDTLYSEKERKTGKGYGVQNFRIPKIRKDEDEKSEKTQESCDNIDHEKRKRCPTPIPSPLPDDDSSDIQETNENDMQEKEAEISANDKKEGHPEETPVPDTTVDLDKPKCVEKADIVADDEKEHSKENVETQQTKESISVDSSKSPPEQTILAQFFANLLSSQNKREKKTALYSLINTFSDSFSSKELSKITKIINADDEENSSEDDSMKKPEPSHITESQKADENESMETENSSNQVVVIPEQNIKAELKEPSKVTKKETTRYTARRRAKRLLSDSSPPKENSVSDSKENDTNQDPTIIDSKDSKQHNDEEVNNVVVSVGERIKSRKRNVASRKYRSELDMLHEDIQDMFIRDGVLTATGKRMCRILKDDPYALATSPRSKSPVGEPTKSHKKPKSKPKSKQTINANETDEWKVIQDVRVVLPKIPDTVADETKSGSRRLTRSMVSQDNEEGSSGDEWLDTACATSSEDDSEDSDAEKGEKDESGHEKAKKAVKTKRKRPKRWASGIIKSCAKKKKKHAVHDLSPATPETEVKDGNQHAAMPLPLQTSLSPQLKIDTNDSSKSMTVPLNPDKSYYVNFGTDKAYACRLCTYSGKFITTHYKLVHKDSEVLCARLSPEAAKAAIEDSKLNLAKYESAVRIKGGAKLDWVCRFCAFSPTVAPTLFYDHLTTHTGEYRHICPYCNVSFCSSKTHKTHLITSHKDEKVEKPIQRKVYNTTIMFGYLCGECNYVQMSRKNVEEHIGKFHSNKPDIHKINLSTKYYTELEKIAEALKQDSEKEDDKQMSSSTPPPPILSPQTSIRPVQHNVSPAEPKVVLPLKKKPGPKSKSSIDIMNDNKKPQPKARRKSLTPSAEDAADDAQEVELPKPLRKKPGPKPGSKNKKTPSSNTVEDTFAGISDLTEFGRNKRAAKEKAQEKLKTIMDTVENPIRRRSVSHDTQKDANKKADGDGKADAQKINVESNVSDGQGKAVQELQVVTKREVEDTATKDDSFSTMKKFNEIDLNVFTCKTDLIEENKKIEEERLKMMEELNNSVKGNRSSLNFIDKLCTRLNNKDDIVIKKEPDELPSTAFSPSTKLELTLDMTSPLSSGKKPILEETDISLPVAGFDVTQKNDDAINSMIEKLKGVLASPKVDFVGSTEEESQDNEIVINRALFGGLVEVTRYTNRVKFSCLVLPCAYSTESYEAFQWHCKTVHGTESQNSDTICDVCGVDVKATIDSSLLENLFKHTVAEHVDFTSLPPESDVPRNGLRIRRLSGDALSLNKEAEEVSEGEQVNAWYQEDVLAETSVDVLQAIHPTSSADLELSEDNPFPFKIADVVSLAEQQGQQHSLSIAVEPSTSSQQQINAPAPPPLTPIGKSTSNPVLVKEAKLCKAELMKPRKSGQAMSIFLAKITDLYKCPQYYCVFTTHVKGVLERHLTQHHKCEMMTMVPCVYCDLKTPWNHIANHIELRHSSSKYSCAYCLYRAIAKEYVLIHQDQTHPKKSYSVIALPPRKNNKRFSITEHKRKPRELCLPYRCSNCPSSVTSISEFLFEDEFSDHLMKHHNTEKYMICPVAQCRGSISSTKLVEHYNTIHGICPYQCGNCSFSSPRSRAVYEHFAIAHPNLLPDIYVRMVGVNQQAQTLYRWPKYFGYTNQAFKVMTKLVGIPNLFPRISPAVSKPAEPQQQQESLFGSNPINALPNTTFSMIDTTEANTTTSSNIIVMPMQPTLCAVMTEPTQSETVTSMAVPTKKIIKIFQMSSASTVTSTNTTEVLSQVSTVSKTANVTTVSHATALPRLATTSQVFSATPQATTAITSVPTKETSACVGDRHSLTVDKDGSPSKTVEDEEDGQFEPLEQVILGTDDTTAAGVETRGEDPLLSLDVSDPLLVDPGSDPLDLGDVSGNYGNSGSTPRRGNSFTSDDESNDASSTSKGSATQKEITGLLGYQLYRCAFCMFSSSNAHDFRNHQVTSQQCRWIDNVAHESNLGHQQVRLFECAHCQKRFRTASLLTEHVQGHGRLKYSCSLCGQMLATAQRSKAHMKTKHNVTQSMLSRVNSDKDDYIIKPKLSSSITLPEPVAEADALTMKKEENITYLPQEIDSVPNRSIFSSEIRCGVCSYSTKVRTNLVRHLQFHQQEKEVPDAAPLNPVPCLEKNEKMFDKMINLAGSSHEKGKIGSGVAKCKDSEIEEPVPEFVPSHLRYACCTEDCSYICPEEGNLRHHMQALHSDDVTLRCRCAHCGVDLGAGADADAVLRHLKLHGKQLFKCSKCSYIHNQRHKVERHTNDEHAAELQAKVVVVRNMDSEPVDSDREAFQPSTSAPSVTKPTKASKPWRCCICKYRGSSEDLIRQHCVEKHDVDCQYKCALCVYKTNDKSAFQQHFVDNHQNAAIDIVYVYVKVDEPKDDQNPEFDTTPLWQRDRPRVRHIRGILFEDTAPATSKGTKKTTKSSTTAAPITSPLPPDSSQPGPSTSRSMTPLNTPKSANSSPKHTPKSPAKQTRSATTAKQESSEALPDLQPLEQRSLQLQEEPPQVQQAVEEQEDVKPSISSLQFATESIAKGAVTPTRTTKKQTSDKGVSDDFFLKVNQIMKKCAQEIEQERVRDRIVNKDMYKYAQDILSGERGLVIPNKNVSVNTDADVNQRKVEDVIVIDDDDDDSRSSLQLLDSVASNKLTQAVTTVLKRKSTDQPASPTAAKVGKSDFIDLVSEDDDEYSERSLKETFGEFGLPLQKQLKCPECNKFKSKRISDFIFHLFKEKKCHRFKCMVCCDESITYRYMYRHVLHHLGTPDKVFDKILPLPPNPRLEAWLQLLINYQTSVIYKHITPVEPAQVPLQRVSKCHTCEQWFKSDSDRNEHAMLHWSSLPYKCDSCKFSSYAKKYVEKHFDTVHKSFSLNVIIIAPTVGLELKFNDSLHMEEVKTNDKSVALSNAPSILNVELPQSETLQKQEQHHNKVEAVDWTKKLENDVLTSIKGKETEAVGEKTNEESDCSQTIIEQPEAEKTVTEASSVVPVTPIVSVASPTSAPPKSTYSPPPSSTSLELSISELMSVSKSAPVQARTVGDIYCCESCPFMSSSESIVEEHRKIEHFGHSKIKVLNRDEVAAVVDDWMACQICGEVGDEIHVRKHFMDKHPEKSSFNVYRIGCGYCDRKFMRIQGLRMHSQRMHPVQPLRAIHVKDNVLTPQQQQKPLRQKRVLYSYSKETLRYSCLLCDYSRICGPQLVANVRAHVKTHFKVLKCVLCDQTFPNRNEGRAHQRELHPQLNCLQTVVTSDAQEAWEKVVKSAKPVTDVHNTLNDSPGGSASPEVFASDSMEEDSMMLDISQEEGVATKNVAKKSTSVAPPQAKYARGAGLPGSMELEPFSYYGIPEEPLHLHDIMTKVDLNGVHMDISADKLARIFDLGAYVLIEDCAKSSNTSTSTNETS